MYCTTITVVVFSVFCVYFLLVVVVWLLIPLQSTAWKDDQLRVLWDMLVHTSDGKINWNQSELIHGTELIRIAESNGLG